MTDEGPRPLSRGELLQFVDTAMLQLAGLRLLILGADLDEPEVESDPALPDGPCPERDGKPHTVEWFPSFGTAGGQGPESGVCHACGAEFTRGGPE